MEDKLVQNALKEDTKSLSSNAEKEETSALRQEISKLKEECLSRENTINDLNQSLKTLSTNALSRKPSHSQMDQDEVAMLMFENENLKKKIKMYEMESSKKDQSDKLQKKIKEKDEEIKNYLEQQKEQKSALVI